MKQRYVVVTEHEAQVQWLEGALGPDAEAVVVDDPTPERVAQLADAASGSTVFVRFSAGDLRERRQLVERLLEIKPHLAVIGIADEEDKDLILAAVRAGARDFLRVGGEARETRSLVDRLLERAPTQARSDRGEQIAIVCARPDIATSTFAVHLALRCVERTSTEQRALMIDLALPASDSLLFLDIQPAYTFIDAVRSVRRFDQTLIETAFSRDRSGLAVLPLPPDPTQMKDVNGNDMLALFSVLKSYFHRTVLNLGGLRDPEFVAQALSQADRTVLLADQSVASCSAARKLLDGLDQLDFDLANIDLVVDRYSAKLDPKADKIAEVLGLRLAGTLAPNGFAMIEAMNCAQSIFEIAPDSGYVKDVRTLTDALLRLEAEAPKRRGLADLGKRARALLSKS